uniref:Uncharacterized protein n=1 Tax=viral metagenome TaxID=1070528 RepID=A0A6C0B935_9ZZZZ
MPDTPTPDLTVYYSLEQQTVTNLLDVSPWRVTISSKPIYSDIALTNKIGEFIFEATSNSVVNSSDTVTSHLYSYSFLFYKNKSSINCTYNVEYDTTERDDHGRLPLNTIALIQITSALGDYITKTGYSIIITDSNTLTRTVNFYFNKTYTATASASASSILMNGKEKIQTATASATSSVSEEDAYNIALTTATDTATMLANAVSA